MIWHVETCWLSLPTVLLQIMEQFENIKDYFLNKLPLDPSFKGKSGVGNSG